MMLNDKAGAEDRGETFLSRRTIIVLHDDR